MMEGDESARGESPGASLGPAAPPQVAGIPLAEESTSPTMKRKMSIDGLRRELEKQTRETQKLQEEVEQATKLTMEKLNYTLSGTDDGGPSSQSTPTTDSSSTSPTHPVVTSPISKSLLQNSAPAPSAFVLDHSIIKKGISYAGKQRLDRALEAYGLHVKQLQRRLNETNELHETQKFHFRQSIIELQTKLQEVQMERDTLLDTRRRESESQNDLIHRLQSTVLELESVNQQQEENLREANSQIEHLRKSMWSHEEVLLEIRMNLASYEERTDRKVYEHESISTLHLHNLGTAVSKTLRDLETEISFVKGRLFPVEDQLEAVQIESQNKVDLLLRQHQERVEQLVQSHEQEVAALTEKANRARSHVTSVQSQMEIIQEQTGNQTAMYMCQLSELESTVSQLRSELREARRIYEDKIEDLEKELGLALSQLSEAQTECDQYSKESGDRDSQLQKLMSDLRSAKRELNLEKEQNKRLWDRDSGNSITIDNLRRELDNRNMEVQHLEALVKTLKNDCQLQMDQQVSAVQAHSESLEKISLLTNQLEVTKEQLHKTLGELAAGKACLEKAEWSVSEQKALLEEKEKAVSVGAAKIKKLQHQIEERVQEVQEVHSEREHLRALMDETTVCLRSLQSESEALKLQLGEREKMIEILRQQVGNMAHIVGQHSRSVDAVQIEKLQLLSEINERKLEIHDLKNNVGKKEEKIQDLEVRLSELELEKVKLLNCGNEKSRAIENLMLEKDKLMSELKITHSQLASLAEQNEVLKKNYRNKSEEMENTISRLKAQLKSSQADLEQTRNTLKAMEGADGHAMKVAMGMQKQITAKRGQIDALQSKMHFLEETVDNTTKDKRYLEEQINKLSQELAKVAAEKNIMASQLDFLRSQERRLKIEVTKMEAALEKASLQFAECQAVIQQQEQEFMRLKLQHALDVKELQGPGYSTTTAQHAPAYHRPHSANLTSSHFPTRDVLTALPKNITLKEDPTRDLKRLLQDLRNVINESHSEAVKRNRSDLAKEDLTDHGSHSYSRVHFSCFCHASLHLIPKDSASGRKVKNEVTGSLSAGSSTC
ncbi:coiled-coil domain-containing protein 158 isoform X3 [Latimeria chalumnae]|uniref:coiled-coil domain-containing protein 158 isoform X3 n=1 Tax=Latimeria chalumnae TaxID=7897 RepID=UPI00313EE206